MKEQELYNALISVNIPETQAKQIAEDAMNEDKSQMPCCTVFVTTETKQQHQL